MDAVQRWEADQWQQIKRHWSKGTTVGAVMRMHYCKGRLAFLKSLRPRPTDDMFNPDHEDFKRLWSWFDLRLSTTLFIKHLPVILYLNFRSWLVDRNYEPYTEITLPNSSTDYSDSAFVNRYAGIIDLLCHEYGSFTLKTVKKLPWSSLGEYILAIEQRHRSESRRKRLEASPYEAYKTLEKIAVRKADYVRELKHQKYHDNLEALIQGK